MNYIGPDKIIEKKKEFYMPCSYHFYKEPPQLVRGEMQYLYDDLGKQYLDFFAGVSVVNCGHCNPEITKVTIEQIMTLQHTTTIYLTQPMFDLAAKLAEILPGNLKRSFFCNSGSEANEGAMLLARLYTNKDEFIFLDGSLHGRTYLTTNVTAIPMWRTDPYLTTDQFHCITRPDSLENAKKSIIELENLLQNRGNKIAGFMAEVLQGNGGIIVPPSWYFEKVQELLRKYNILMIIDEVQTGFARTGKMFAIEHFNVVPDIIVMAKALGNGIPISAFSTTDEIASKFTKPSASTLGGNLVSTKTALAVLDYILNNDLVRRSNELGLLLKNELLKLKQKYPFIKDVRGLGLMLGVELESNGQPLSNETDYILEEMKNKGILIGKNGLNRNILALQPPLVISKENIIYLINCLDEVLSNIKY